MKRIVTLLCVFSLLFIICACGKTDGDLNEAPTVSTTADTYGEVTATDETAAATEISASEKAKNISENATEAATAADKTTTKEHNENATTTKTNKNETQTAKQNKDKSDKNNTTTTKKVQENSSTKAVCNHKNTITKNQLKQNCTESGYTGDIYCSDCGKLIEKGEEIEPDGHLSVEVYNIIQPTKNTPGYTGDKRCRICGAELEKGEIIPKLSPDPEPVSHNNAALEYELLDMINAERIKEGYSPLYFNENAYRCAKIRTGEIMVKFSHERPVGGYFDSILTNDGVSYSTAGENIQRGTADNSVQQMVDAFMNSEAHRANIMNNKYSSAAICIEYAAGAYFITQIFIG